jgi:hypothetical protein
MAEFQTMYNRFADQGLLILAVTGEDNATVKSYLAEHPIYVQRAIGSGDVTKKQSLIDGLPHSLLYNREGKMVPQIPRVR